MIGQTISHHKINEKLGEDGRGIITRAKDAKLNAPRNWSRFFLVALIFMAVSLAKTQSEIPEHAVIFIIDGLSYKAPERLPLKNFQALSEQGVYYEKSYNVMPAHPKSGEWAESNSSSIPNPVLLAGTALLAPDQRYIQQSFFPDQITAHAANAVDYRTLNVGFHLTFMAGSDDNPVRDEETMYWALHFLRKAQPKFMRIHLQDVGYYGWLSHIEKDRSVPWYRDIWAEGSPYRKAAVQADEYLGRFTDELKRLRIYEKTLLFVTADHGESDRGWHPPEDPDGWAMPLLVTGPGVKKGERFDYAEQIDIVPTLAHLMGVRPPSNADGRILVEALVRPPSDVPVRKQSLKDLNEVLLEGEKLLAEWKEKAAGSTAYKRRWSRFERNFLGIERVLEWRHKGSLEELIRHNRRVIDETVSQE